MFHVFFNDRAAMSMFFKVMFVCFGLVSSHSALALVTCSVRWNLIAFGNYDPLSYVPLDNSSGSVEVVCRTDVPTTVGYSIVMSPGFSGTINPRKMVGAQNITLEYNLYTDIARQTIWGDGPTGGKISTGFLLPTANTDFSGGVFPIYSRIFPRQMGKPAGTYTDSIQVTVSY
jgi:spore coat protein U-like protein